MRNKKAPLAKSPFAGKIITQKLPLQSERTKERKHNHRCTRIGVHTWKMG